MPDEILMKLGSAEEIPKDLRNGAVKERRRARTSAGLEVAGISRPGIRAALADLDVGPDWSLI